ncbi:tetratricopeptide repeat protein [Orientia tsutsugamushi]|uniref:TPR repeat-containing protein 08 n=1 Tax=Orientia tsutsugamushi TaxID=784 RepID=A0A2U3RST1_ORITS|nr:tetratricopeptide repeat protein [Orientia tsutsugamushi]SPR16271.1 TPR repeat-containing protein 08 [Orientia tsutsugamushi]
MYYLHHRYVQGIALYELGQYQEAIDNYDIAIKHKPDLAEAYMNKGVALRKLGQHQEAIKKFNLAIKYNPGLIAPYISKVLKKLEMQ